jgi:hypothetical protein
MVGANLGISRLPRMPRADIVTRIKTKPITPEVYTAKTTLPRSYLSKDDPSYFYHATAHTRPIIESGMLRDIEREESKRIAGLGGSSGGRPGVSTMPGGLTQTANALVTEPGYPLAASTAADIRRMALLSRGERGIQALGGWIKEDTRKWAAYNKRMGLTPQPPAHEQTPTEATRALLDHYRRRIARGEDPREAAVRIYAEHYLPARGLTRGAPDPNFVGLDADAFAKIDPKDVGVLAIPKGNIPSTAAVIKGQDRGVLPGTTKDFAEARISSQIPVDNALLIQPDATSREFRSIDRARHLKALMARGAATVPSQATLQQNVQNAVNKAGPYAQEYLDWLHGLGVPPPAQLAKAKTLLKESMSQGRPLDPHYFVNSGYYPKQLLGILAKEVFQHNDELGHLVQAVAEAPPGSALSKLATAKREGVANIEWHERNLAQYLTPAQQAELRRYTLKGEIATLKAQNAALLQKQGQAK